MKPLLTVIVVAAIALSGCAGEDPVVTDGAEWIVDEKAGAEMRSRTGMSEEDLTKLESRLEQMSPEEREIFYKSMGITQ